MGFQVEKVNGFLGKSLENPFEKSLENPFKMKIIFDKKSGM